MRGLKSKQRNKERRGDPKFDLLPTPDPGEVEPRLATLFPWVEHHYGRVPTPEEMEEPHFTTLALQQLYLQGLVIYHAPAAAALHAGVSVYTAQKWRQEDPEFDAWCIDATKASVDMTEAGLTLASRAGNMNAFVFLQSRRSDVYTYPSSKLSEREPSQIQVVVINQLPDGSQHWRHEALFTQAPKNVIQVSEASANVKDLPDGSR